MLRPVGPVSIYCEWMKSKSDEIFFISSEAACGCFQGRSVPDREGDRKEERREGGQEGRGTGRKGDRKEERRGRGQEGWGQEGRNDRNGEGRKEGRGTARE